MGRGPIVVENIAVGMLRARNTVDIGSVCFGRAARYLVIAMLWHAELRL